MTPLSPSPPARPRLAATLVLLGAATGCTATLPPPPAHAVVVPDRAPSSVDPLGPGVPRAPLQVCWLEYAHRDEPAGYALAGPSSRPAWHVTSSGLLLRHPAGHLLLDLGNSTRFDAEQAELGLIERQYRRLGPGSLPTEKSLPRALAEVGEAPSSLLALVVSHIHPDHVGGVDDLPGIPVFLAAGELAFARQMKGARSFAVAGAHAAALEERGKPLDFLGKPYENFDASLDYFGDGSVVFVSLAGHTPGSLGTFVTLGSGRRLFHVGDAVDSTEAIDRRVGKSWALGWTDADRAEADRVVARLSQLHEEDPSVVFLPAHDRDAWMTVFPGGPGTCVTR